MSATLTTLETMLRTRPESSGALLLRIGDRFGVSPDEILSHIRLQHIAQARHVVAWILHRRGLSYPAIARELGDRDHTTIMNSVRKIEEQMRAAPALVELLEDLLNPPEARR